MVSYCLILLVSSLTRILTNLSLLQCHNKRTVKQGSFKRYVEAYYPQGYHGVNCKEGISFYHNHVDVFSEIWVGGSCFKRITCNRISWVLVPNYNKVRIRIEPFHLRQGSTCVIRDGQRKVMSLNYNQW